MKKNNCNKNYVVSYALYFWRYFQDQLFKEHQWKYKRRTEQIWNFASSIQAHRTYRIPLAFRNAPNEFSLWCLYHALWFFCCLFCFIQSKCFAHLERVVSHNSLFIENHENLLNFIVYASIATQIDDENRP